MSNNEEYAKLRQYLDDNMVSVGATTDCKFWRCNQKNYFYDIQNKKFYDVTVKYEDKFILVFTLPETWNNGRNDWFFIKNPEPTMKAQTDIYNIKCYLQ